MPRHYSSYPSLGGLSPSQLSKSIGPSHGVRIVHTLLFPVPVGAETATGTFQKYVALSPFRDQE